MSVMVAELQPKSLFTIPPVRVLGKVGGGVASERFELLALF